MKQIFNKLTGKASFEVDEAFVFNQVSNDINEEEREILSMFIAQSEEAQAEKEEDAALNDEVVKGAYYRICDVPPRQCDDSPLEDIVYPERITSKRKAVFKEGTIIKTDGTGRRTKLTKIFKRKDNRGALLNALKRMKLDL